MKRRRRLAVLSLALVAGTVLFGALAGPSVAIIRRRTITPEVDTGLPIRTDGRQVSMTGPMACDPGENWEVSGRLTQGVSRGGGRSEGICRGDIQEWVVRVAAEGDVRFEPGPAQGCAVLRTLRNGVETDRHEWCNDIALAAAGTESDDGDEGSTVSWVALVVGGLAAVVALAALLRPHRG
ncbi:MAG TPA: hypothetical protein VHF24_12310 [Acidimicrobiales bacterium]|nr:hypothetical protein [Acidimicrobiales bacterium]